MTARSEFIASMMAQAQAIDFAAWSFWLCFFAFLLSLTLAFSRQEYNKAAAKLPFADDTIDSHSGGSRRD